MKSSLLFALIGLFLVPVISHAGRAPAVVSKSKKNAIEALAQKKNLGSFMTVVQLWSPASDSAFIQNELKNLKMRRSTKLGIQVTGRNSFTVSGLGKFDVRRNGKELTFKGQVFHLNSNYSLQKNVENISAQLSKSKVTSLLIPSAHAADPEEVQIVRQRALWMGTAIAYLSMYDQQNKTIDELTNEPGIAGLLGFDPPMEVGDINCDERKDGNGNTEIFEIDIRFRSGQEVSITQGENSIYTFTNVDQKQIYPSEDIYYSNLFKDLANTYCTAFTEDSAGRALKQATILKANGVMLKLAEQNKQGGGPQSPGTNNQVQ